MGFVPAVFWNETNQEAQRTVTAFLKMAETRFAQVNENDFERIINAAVPKSA